MRRAGADHAGEEPDGAGAACRTELGWDAGWSLQGREAESWLFRVAMAGRHRASRRLGEAAACGVLTGRRRWRRAGCSQGGGGGACGLVTRRRRRGGRGDRAVRSKEGGRGGKISGGQRAVGGPRDGARGGRGWGRGRLSGGVFFFFSTGGVGRDKKVIRRGLGRDKKVVRMGSRIAILDPLKGGCRIVLLSLSIYIYIG